MIRKESKPKEPKPWDRRPWPANGDADINKTYAAVGIFLSQWERYEGALSFLFSAFVSRVWSKAASRAYDSVRTFEGRADMLRAASEAYFDENPDNNLQESFKVILREATCFSARRNEVAHGVTDRYIPEGYMEEAQLVSDALDYEYALYPSYASFKERSLGNVPTYCYTSTEMAYFCVEFRRMTIAASTLAGHLLNRTP